MGFGERRKEDGRMTSPSDVPACPPWLTHLYVDKRPKFCLGEEVIEALDHDDITEPDLSIERWLEWRSRVAAALGLLEPAPIVHHPDGSSTWRTPLGEELIKQVRREAAAELRAMATEYDAPAFTDDTTFGNDVARRLRARADELDPSSAGR